MTEATMSCGEMCAGCTDECAACAAQMCADCGGCDHQRKLTRRARVAGAGLVLHQIASGVPTEFGFNPGQKRGPDGKFIKMGGRGSAGKGGLPKGASRKSAVATDAAPAVDDHGVTEGTRAAELRDAQTERIRASTRTDTLERNAEVMYGSDRSKWPAKVRQDLEKARRRDADAARDEQAAVNKRETEAARERVIARAQERQAAIESGDRGPAPVGFKPNTDADWRLLEKRLGKRTARTDPEGDLQIGDVVPTHDGKWQTVEGGQIYPRRDADTHVNVKDDAKGYRHTEAVATIKRRIEEYNAEKAWRGQGGSKDRLDGVAAAPVAPTGRRPGEPEIGPDGKYAKPTKQYAVWNGEVYTRTSRNPYRYASVISHRTPNDGGDFEREGIWSWHTTRENAARGVLTGSQRQNGLYVKDVVETQFEDPGLPSWQATRAEADAYGQRLEEIARGIRDRFVDFDERPGEFDQFRERELSDRLQSLVDARAEGNERAIRSALIRIRQLLLRTGATTEGALPPVPRGAGLA